MPLPSMRTSPASSFLLQVEGCGKGCGKFVGLLSGWQVGLFLKSKSLFFK